MKKIKAIIKKELKLKVLTRGFIIGTILGPVLIFLFAFGPAFFFSLSKEKPVKLAIVDNTHQLEEEIHHVFTDTLKNGQPRFIITMLDSLEFVSRQQQWFEELEKEKLKALLVIPASVWKGKKVVYYSKNVGNIDFISNLKERLSKVLTMKKLKDAGVDPQVVEKLTATVSLDTRVVEKGSAKQRSAGQMWIMAFGLIMMLYMTSIFYGNAVMRGVLEEKTSRIVEILLSSMNAFELMLGKIFGIGLVGLIQYLFWGVMGVVGFLLVAASKPDLLTKINIEPYIFGYFVLFFLIGYFQIAGLFAAVGSMAASEEDMQPLAMPVNLLIVIPFIISFSVLNDPNGTLAQTLSFIPFFTPILMFLRIMLIHPPWYEIWSAVLINILAILAFGWLSARIYRVGILMYGKRPNLPEIVRWIRYR